MNPLQVIPVRTEVLTGNVKPLLHEIRHALRRLADGGEGTTIDLRGLPLAPGEEERIEAVLGSGEIRAELQALGTTDILETAFPGVWLVTHKNASGDVAARLIEVTRVPDIVLAQRADMLAGLDRLERELQE